MLFVETDAVTFTGDEIRVGNQTLPFARVEKIRRVEGGVEVWYREAA